MTATRSAFVIALSLCWDPRLMGTQRPWGNSDARVPTKPSGKPQIPQETQTLRAGPRRCQSRHHAAYEVEEHLGAERLLEHGDVGGLEKRPPRVGRGVPRDETEVRRQRRGPGGRR